jgi:hypothetical protein
MVAITILWPLAMIGVATLSYSAHENAISQHNGDVLIVGNRTGGYDIEYPREYRARGLSGAFFTGLLVPTLVYLPSMFMLFVIWFVLR